MIGTTIGPYEIVAKIGEGGMGVVYRARDTRLHRDVAIKVLPTFLANDPERLTRLDREARLLAALNHPYIATIHGLEERGDVRALVMELVDGPTLDERLARGLPLTQILTIAKQLAEALEAAHERGIVHRDLKPANIKLSQSGFVKVLDFGLAKAFSTDGTGSEQSHLPTVTGSLDGGRIVGTPAYMSPEQARGQAVDKRTDIWAFGCVLFEMITSRPVFSGPTVSDTIAAILERSPDWSTLPADTPPGVRRVLRRCLEKEPRNRWHDIGDVRIELEDTEAGPAMRAAPAGSSRVKERIAWSALTLAAAAAALLTPAFRPAIAAREVRFDVVFPRDVPADFAQLAVSPDGQQIVAAPSFAPQQAASLWLRPIGSTAGRFLLGTEGANLPFWSPDGESIGFFAEAKLKRVDVKSQAVEIIADAPVARGGAWQNDGTILFAPQASGPLYRVPASGGTPSAATHLEAGQNDHRAPVILPDRQHFLYYSRGTPQVRGIWVARIDGTDPKRLLDADAASVYSPSGHLLFPRQGELLAQAFDAKTLTLSGEPFRLADRVSVNPGVSLASLSASESGTIVWGTGDTRRTQLAWFDRSGKRLETVGPADLTNIANPALSPDGHQVAFVRSVGGNWDIWLVDMQGVVSKFTSTLALDFNPMWAADGHQIFFESNNSTIHSRSVNDGAPEQVTLQLPTMLYPSDVSPDGRFLLFTKGVLLSTDLWYMPLTGDRTPHPFVETTFQDRDGQFSPDGKWVAYQSNESGRFEIYLRPFPGPGERTQVSAGGGQQPRWAKRSGELFYVAGDQKLVSVAVKGSADGKAQIGESVPLFQTAFDNSFLTRQQYVVSPDGQRFLLNASIDTLAPPSFSVILNWKGRP